MKHPMLTAGAVALVVATAGTGASLAAGAAAPKRANVKIVTTLKVKVNRYIQDGLRFQKDVYAVRSGGSVRIVNAAGDEGPHTFTIVRKKDLPRTPRKILNCSLCDKLGQAHGADPNSDAPPKFLFLENGVGTTTSPNFDRPGDSAFVGPNKGDAVTVKVTARKGTKLNFLCLIHPWMQSRIIVR